MLFFPAKLEFHLSKAGARISPEKTLQDMDSGFRRNDESEAKGSRIYFRTCMGRWQPLQNILIESNSFLKADHT
ncbi:MAG: hypothetical protein CVU57_22320 [Deltaproteobacteria bacterium HGW-Deltaproteobacteria-15]|nr:MAG: hypothetical protein CVU57_22320 [Deltaproteobacteria bacterium HGW-Deltaproteobacteria-15]